MSEFDEAGKVAGELLKKNLGAENITMIRTAKVGETWEVEAEIYEESAFIKALGLQTRVRDRNVYLVKLNDRMEVESYERKASV